MGNFLDTPNTEKHTEVGSSPENGLSYGVSAMQGWRSHMEDDHCTITNAPQNPTLSLFGVYDGHGGNMAARYMAKHFPEKFFSEHKISAEKSEFRPSSQKAFETSLLSIDEDMRQLPEVESGQDQSGSTSVMVLLSPDTISCANTGDSRAILCREGGAVGLSEDHKPSNPGEKARIENAGSHVKFDRVNGDLAVSRAVGDFSYKRCDSLPAEKQAVTAFPEMTFVDRVPGKDEFIVIACDGIWDVMTNQECADKVREMLLNGRPALEEESVAAKEGMEPDMDSGAASARTHAEDEGVGSGAEEAPPKVLRPWDLGAVCEELIMHCLRRGSRDNMSVVIVLLNQQMAPKPE